MNQIPEVQDLSALPPPPSLDFALNSQYDSNGFIPPPPPPLSIDLLPPPPPIHNLGFPPVVGLM